MGFDFDEKKRRVTSPSLLINSLMEKFDLRRGNEKIEQLFAARIPMKYKKGSWSPLTVIMVFVFAGILIVTFPAAKETRSDFLIHSDFFSSYKELIENCLAYFRLVVGFYGIFMSLTVFYLEGIWPFTSFTLTSWNLMSLRLLSAYFANGGIGEQKNSGIWSIMATFTKFPSLLMCTITVVIWWMVLFPVILLLIEKKKRIQFVMWNISFPLLNFHLFNLLFILVDFLFSACTLTGFDLWLGLVALLCYGLFYMNVMDPLGLYFYPIFSPRAHWCFIPLLLMFLMATLLCSLYNQTLAAFLLSTAFQSS